MNAKAALTSEEFHEVTGTYLGLCNLRGRKPTLVEVQKETHLHPERVARVIRVATRRRLFGFRA